MIAFSVKLTIERGATFRKTMVWKSGDSSIPSSLAPIDLTGYTGRMQIRSDSLSSVVIQELNTTNGYITLGGITGTIILYLPNSVTSAFTFKRAVYDVFLTSPSGDVVKFMEGTVTLAAEVTR